MNFSDLHAYPSIVSAVSAGRFALSRTQTLSHIFGSETPSSSQLTGQEVRVIQTYNGRQLLRVPTSPIQRVGQNFALSPDGLSLAVIHDNAAVHGEETLHDTAVEIYDLPQLSQKDRKEIDAEAALAPPHTETTMHFSIGEIKAALATMPAATENGANVSKDTERHDPNADARIVGDPVTPSVAAAVSPATSAIGSIPASDPAPACAGLIDPGVIACPVKPEKKSPSDPAGTAPESPSNRPTLYQPSEAPAPAPKSSPQ